MFIKMQCPCCGQVMAVDVDSEYRVSTMHPCRPMYTPVEEALLIMRVLREIRERWELQSMPDDMFRTTPTTTRR